VRDFGALWLASQIRTGETVMALRLAGHDWREIAAELRIGDVDTIRRAAALYLSHDIPRRTHGEAAGEAHRPADAGGRD
jgi:hypothetical protein